MIPRSPPSRECGPAQRNAFQTVLIYPANSVGRCYSSPRGRVHFVLKGGLLVGLGNRQERNVRRQGQMLMKDQAA